MKVLEFYSFILMKDYLILQESKNRPDVFCCEHFVETKWRWKFNEIKKKKKRINQYSDGMQKFRHSVEGYFPSIKRPIKTHQLISIGGVSRSHVFPTQVIGFCC